MEKTAGERINEYLELVLLYLKGEGLVQLGILLATIACGFLVYLIALKYLKKWVSAKPDSAAISTGYKWVQRILLPTTMFFVFLLTGAILSIFGVPANILEVLAPIALSLAFIRFFIYLLRKTLSPGPLLKTFENFLAFTIWILVILYLLNWLPEISQLLDSIAITLGENRFSVLSLFKLLIYSSIFLLGALYLSRVIEKQLHSNALNLPVNVQVGATKIIKLGLFIMALLIALNSVGIDLTIFTVLGGAIGVGVGFGLQKIASNYISGFILIMDKSIKPGDVISIGEHFGWVEQLKGRYIVVRDRNGIETLIPNETLVTNQVINWSYGDKKVRIKMPIQVSYDDNPKECLAILLSCAHANPRVLDEPEPVARLIEFGDNGISLELRIWIEDPENGAGEVKTDIYLAIWEEFKKSKVTIPYPQRDVHIKNGA